MLQGLGRLYYKDRSFYIGQFDEGLKNGFGKMIYSDKDDRLSFEGEWVDDVKTDTGTMIWKREEQREFNFRLGIHLVLLFIFSFSFCVCRCITSYYE